MKIIVDNKKFRKKMIDMNIQTITELSNLSGVSRPKIYQYLNGSNPFTTTFSRLCESLELNPIDLILVINDDKEKDSDE